MQATLPLPVLEAIADTYHDRETQQSVYERALEAHQTALDLAAKAHKMLTPEAQADIAKAAISSLEPAESALAVYHALNGWLGGPNVPSTLTVSWDPARRTAPKGAPNVLDHCKSCDHCVSAPSPEGGVAITMTPNRVCLRPGGLCAAMQKFADNLVAEELGTEAVPEITAERGAELAEVQGNAALANQAVMDAEGVYRALGQLEGAMFFATVADVVIAQTYVKIRESKKYKGLPYLDPEGNLRQVATLEEFCSVKLGKSYRRVKELADNLHLLGPALYETAENIGFRSRDYRALKALPSEEQETIKQALGSETKEQVVELLQDLTERHASERAAAKKERDNLQADLDARGKVLEDKARRLEKTEMELAKLKSLPPDESLTLRLAREEEATKALDAAYVAALAGLNKFLVQVDTMTEGNAVSSHTKQYAVQTVQAYCEDIQAALTDHAIPVNFEDMVSPAWAKSTAKAEIKAGIKSGQNILGVSL